MLYLCQLFLQYSVYMTKSFITILVAVLSISGAMLLLCIRIILVKNGKFNSQHISANKRMQQDDIRCVTSQDREARKNNTNKIDISKL